MRFAKAVVVWETYSLDEYPDRSPRTAAKDDDGGSSNFSWMTDDEVAEDGNL